MENHFKKGTIKLKKFLEENRLSLIMQGDNLYEKLIASEIVSTGNWDEIVNFDFKTIESGEEFSLYISFPHVMYVGDEAGEEGTYDLEVEIAEKLIEFEWEELAKAIEESR